jgi:cell wall-associated NlpC family hydrolase
MKLLRTLPFIALLLSACGHQPTRPELTASKSPQAIVTPRGTLAAAAANAVLFRALALVGTPYRYGGNTPEGGFDCSGLVGYVFRDAAGVVLPRNSAEIGALKSPNVGLHELMSGDLVFFGSGRSITHVGIYVGEGRFVHAPNSGGTVRLDRLDARGWRENFRHGKRILR